MSGNILLNMIVDVIPAAINFETTIKLIRWYGLILSDNKNKNENGLDEKKKNIPQKFEPPAVPV